MEITKIFKNSLNFPISNYEKLLIIGVICVLSSITSIYSSFGLSNDIVSLILGIVSIIAGLILGGYLISVIKDTIDGSDEIPDFDWKNNIIMGIKYAILKIVYTIIPTIILIIIAYATGLLDSAYQIIQNVDVDLLSTATNQTATTQAFSKVPETALNTFATSITIIIIVAIILIIIFGLLSLAATCRLANTGKLGSSLNIKEVFEDITEIGWGNFIIWVIIFVIICLILGLIAGAVSAIPYVGIIISTLIISPFIVLFIGRSMGLLYSINKLD